MKLSEDEELAVIKATVQLRLKPFGPNKAFHMTSLAAHLQTHDNLDLTPEQLLSYFDSLFDLRFFESRSRNVSLPSRTRPTQAAVKEKVQVAIEDDETVESGQEDVGSRRQTKRRPSRPPTPKITPSVRSARTSINYKE
jgi:hypothetical protein